MEKNTTERKMSVEKETTSVKTENVQFWTSQERETSKSLYGCEILKENCTYQEANAKDVPNDAHIISYIVNDKMCYDLTRGAKVRLFNMYWDKFRDNLKSIQWGSGTINPKLWGYKAPERKKRK
jgi:hypothetical protein